MHNPTKDKIQILRSIYLECNTQPKVFYHYAQKKIFGTSPIFIAKSPFFNRLPSSACVTLTMSNFISRFNLKI